MLLIDIHTHSTSPCKHIRIISSETTLHTKEFCSLGIHPWDADDNWENRFAEIKKIAKEKSVVAIGECGLDMIKSPTTAKLQEKIFEQHIELSESLEKPLIIHLVKGMDRLLHIAKNTPHRQAWIIHGFRGKPEQAKQLTKAGMYLSFGEKFNPEALKNTPTNRLFVESDESNKPIEEIYNNIAKCIGTTIEELALQVMQNAKRCRLIDTI